VVVVVVVVVVWSKGVALNLTRLEFIFSLIHTIFAVKQSVLRVVVVVVVV